MGCFIGQIELFPYDFAPMYWLRCNGTLISIRQYPELYTLLGTRYGGDGVDTFGLPNLQGTEPIPWTNYCICVQEGDYPQP